MWLFHAPSSLKSYTMLVLQCALVAALAGLSGAAPANTHRHVVHEERRSAAWDWVKSERIEGSAILPMRIGLTQSNLENGNDLLMEV